MKKNIFPIIFCFFILTGCARVYNVDAEPDSVSLRPAQDGSETTLVLDLREESKEMIAQAFADIDNLERYTEKSKTPDDRFKRIMRDFKNRGEGQ